MTDGRDIDTAIATLEGEAAQQQTRATMAAQTKSHPRLGTAFPDIGADTTYYGRPMLKQSVWSIDIPIYYFLGGTAGAALTLGAATQLACPHVSSRCGKWLPYVTGPVWPDRQWAPAFSFTILDAHHDSCT